VADDQKKQETEKPEGKGGEKDAKPAKKKKKLPILPIIVVLALVAGAAGGAFLAPKFMGKKDGGHTESPAADPDIEALKADAKDPHAAATKDPHAAAASGGHGEAKPAKKDAHGGGGEGEAAAEPEKPPIFRLTDPVVTNLGNSRRIVIAKVWFETANSEDAAFLAKNEHHLMNTLVFLFGNKTVDDVTSVEGKEQIVREILRRVDETVVKGKVKAVGFDQMHVQ
jgi:flagellar basal body-associated protein FliL